MPEAPPFNLDFTGAIWVCGRPNFFGWHHYLSRNGSFPKAT